MRAEYYDREGNPLTLEEYVELVKRVRSEYKRVALDRLVLDGVAVEVSTVWLGLDHAWGDDDPPLIFETMVFGVADDSLQCRYSTEEEARAGHRKVVDALKQGRQRPRWRAPARAPGSSTCPTTSPRPSMASCGKLRYRDRVAALLALASTRSRRHEGRPKAEQRAYRCPDCQGWHLTSRR